MIPAPPGLVARYKHVENDHKHYTTKPIIAFDDDGHPLVIDDSSNRDATRLVPATIWANYAGMGEDPHPPFISLIPGGGWLVEYESEPDGGKWTDRILAWGLKADGDVVALSTDAAGYVEEAACGKYRIYHPDGSVAKSASET